MKTVHKILKITERKERQGKKKEVSGERGREERDSKYSKSPYLGQVTIFSLCRIKKRSTAKS